MEGMTSIHSKAHVRSKSVPFDLSMLSPALAEKQIAKMEIPKTEAVEISGKAETFDFPKIEKFEPRVKAEPLDLPKIEKLELFGKTEPLDFPTAKTVKLFGQLLVGPMFGDEERKNLLLKLSKVRDFVRLMLNYPIRTVHDSKLKAWTCEASNRRLLPEDLNRLLAQKPLKCFQGLLPIDILESVEKGWGPIFDDYYVMPRAILNLSVNLAVNQLLQTLLSEDDHLRNIHHVLLSARDGAEKRLVTEKIESVLKDKENMLRLHETFTGVLLIDASYYESQVEVHVRRQIAQQLQLSVIEGNDEWLMTSIEKEMSSRKYLVVLVDGDDAKEPLDLQKVGFQEEELAGVVVLITIEAEDELTLEMDLNIRIEDHLLPWEVFYRIVGNEFLCSSNAIQTIAARIVEECGSHLLAIAIVAKSLSNANVNDWERALNKLYSLHPSYDMSMFHGQSRVLVKAFMNFIWRDFSNKCKHCLTCCLFIPEIKYGKLQNELINDWISYQLVAGGDAEPILRKLVDHFVLLQFEDTKSRYIQMPEDMLFCKH